MVVGRRNHALLVTLSVLLVFSLKCLASRKGNWDVVPPGCMNCTICPYSCYPPSPPPPPSLPDVVPPPPPVLPYPSDVGPPSPPPPLNCTTVVPVQCCQYPPPTTFPTTITPPVGFGYQPVDNYSALRSPVHFMLVMVSLLLSIVALL